MRFEDKILRKFANDDKMQVVQLCLTSSSPSKTKKGVRPDWLITAQLRGKP